jgi:serine O-acetyltransferase
MFRAFKEQIDALFGVDPAANSSLEVVLCYPGFHAIMLHQVSFRQACVTESIPS